MGEKCEECEIAEEDLGKGTKYWKTECLLNMWS